MGALLDVILFLLFIVVPAVAIGTQVIPLRLSDITFHDTDLEHAWGLVAQYAYGTFEQRFGYPTGYFYLDEKRSRPPARLLMREYQPAGAITDGCSAQLGAASLSGFEGGCLTGCMGIMVIAFIGAPFFLVSACDRFFRLVLRSRVDVSLAASGPDTVASFAFHGPGGYSLRRRYARTFEKPVLPASLGLDVAPEGRAGNPPPEGGPSGGGQQTSGRRPAGGRHASGNAA